MLNYSQLKLTGVIDVGYQLVDAPHENTIFYDLYSNKEIYTFDSYNTLAIVEHLHHQVLASGPDDSSCIFYFQPVFSQLELLIITYMFYYIYVVKHICEITYTNNMTQEKIEELVASIKSDMAILSDLQREEKSKNFSNKIFLQRPGVYSVQSETSKTKYTVDTTDNSCTCPDNVHRGVACKHIRAVMKLSNKVGLWV